MISTLLSLNCNDLKSLFTELAVKITKNWSIRPSARLAQKIRNARALDSPTVVPYRGGGAGRNAIFSQKLCHVVCSNAEASIQSRAGHLQFQWRFGIFL